MKVFFEKFFWLRSTRPQYFVVTIQMDVSSAKFFLLLLSADRMGGASAHDKFYFGITYLSDPSPIITLISWYSAKFFPPLLLSARMGGSAAYDKSYFEKNIFIRFKSDHYIAFSVTQFQTWLMWLWYAKMPTENLSMWMRNVLTTVW